MKLTSLYISILLVATGNAVAQTSAQNRRGAAPPITSDSTQACPRFEAIIDRELKEIAFVRMHGLGDNSAPRASNRLQSELTRWSSIQTMLMQMGQLRCQPIDLPIDAEAYIPAAGACTRALLKMDLQPNPDPSNGLSAETKEACNRSNWVRK